jgi:hypothetical protein
MEKEQQPKKITPLTAKRFEIENLDYKKVSETGLPIWKGWKTWEELYKRVLDYGCTEWESKKAVAAIRYLFPDWENKTEEERLPDYEELFESYPLGVALHRSERKRGHWYSLLPILD